MANLTGSTTAIFPIRLSVAVASPVDVEWATRDGSAIAGSDYKAASGTVTFLPGETEKQIEVQVYGQAITPADDKVFFIRLNPPSNAVLVDAILTCTINIIDDQGIPSVAVVVAEGRRGPKGDPGLSAYEQAVLMGYTGTLAEWMDQIADASKAADRAEGYAISAGEDALKAQNAAKNAVFAGVIFPTTAEGIDPILGVQNGAYFNVRSPLSYHYIDEYQNVNGVAVATGKSYPTAEHFQNISEHTALPFVPGESYALNRRVQLDNGDIVKSTVDGNVTDPNVDMTGWVQVNDASQIFFGTLDQAKINYDLFNTPELYGADAGAQDNTTALQAWLDSGKVLHIRPFKVYKFSGTLTLTVVDQTIIGLTHQKYGNARLLYTGAGTAISALNNVGYFSPKSWSLVCQVTEEGAAYKPNTTGLDIPSGTTIEAFDWSLMGFDRLYSGAGTSYYNKFYFCRFSDFNEGFYNIASYNNNFVGCRWNKFTKALRVLGGSGPLNIDHCSFERFNGNIVDSFATKCLVNFTNNYVEIFDSEELPLHYVQASNQTKGRYWGGNVLFLGSFASLNINKSQLSIAGVFRVGNFVECDALDCSGNIVSLYIAGNNLDRLFQNVGQYTSFNVNDVIYGNLGANGGYTRTYIRSSASLKNVRNKYFYYDCILDKVQPLLSSLAIINPANGWSANTANEPNVGVIALDDGSTFLGGALYGTVKTSNVAFTVPASHRPIELGVTQASCVLRAVNIADGTNVLFKYTYSNGELELIVTTPPATLGNVLLNAVIPPHR